MKTLPRPVIITPNMIVLALLAAAITFIDVTGQRVPFLSNTRVNIILLVVIGMAICSQYGIGRVAATGQWAHPLSVAGYIFGGLILLVALAVFENWNLPFIQNDQQALLAIAIFACIKVVGAATHHFLTQA